MIKIAIKSVVLTSALIFLESYHRKNNPESLFRPSVSISIVADNGSQFFKWFGNRFALFTDIRSLVNDFPRILRNVFDKLLKCLQKFFDFIACYLPIEDFKNIVLALYSFTKIPVSFLNGYELYYNFSSNDIFLGAIGSLIILLIVYHKYFYKKMIQNQSLTQIFKKILRISI